MNGFVRFLVLGLYVVALSAGCKKDRGVVAGGASKTGSRADLTKDSIFLYAKETYYWNSSLPDYAGFSPRNFSSNQDELFAITQTPLNPQTGKPYEFNPSYPSEPKYSFIDDGSVADELNGTAGDFGFSVGFNDITDLRVKYVYSGSSAGKAGLKRGDQVMAVDGRTDLNGTSQASIDYLNSVLFGSHPSINLTIKKADGTVSDVTVARTNYSLDPVLFTHVFDLGTKKVGYIVFNEFTRNSSQELTGIINGFKNQGITDLIVDLRYNGGGSVTTATDFSNLIAPASATGKVMFTTYFNETLRNVKTQQQRRASILINQPLTNAQGQVIRTSQAANGMFLTMADIPFEPTADAANVEMFQSANLLNLNTVYFIVTGSTASASELLINNVKPIIPNVQLIGRTTYGKPVGFFPIHIEKFDVYMPQFETRNQLDQGGYYTGMTVNKEDYDDRTKDFGDSTERYLAYALYHARTGTYPAAGTAAISGIAPKTSRANMERAEKATTGLDKGFKGMVLDRVKTAQ